MQDDLIDRIYEAAFVPDEWPDVLERTSSLSDSVSGAIFIFNGRESVRGRATASVAGLLDRFLSSDQWKQAESVQGTLAIQPAEFIHVDAVLAAEDLDRDPIRKVLRQAGIGSNLATTIPLPYGDTAIFVFNRLLESGGYVDAHIEPLNALRPHFGRAALVAARLGLERAQSTVNALAELGLPAAVIHGGGTVVATNELFERLGSLFQPSAFGQLKIADEPADLLFREALEKLKAGGASPVRSIPIAATGDRPTMVLHFLPIRGAAIDIFSGADILLATTSVDPHAQVPSLDILNALFDLSPAEARLAVRLAAGLSIRQAAIDSGITLNSARTYLARVFRKTGTSQQSQLVALLKTVQPFPTRS